MQKKLSLFKELFSEYPNISILYINNSLNFISKPLEEISNHNKGSIKYIEFKNENCAKLKASAKEFEYIVLGDILSYCKEQKQILQLMYKALENSGNIIILENKNHDNKYQILDLLEECGFTAQNNIELFDDYFLITAKKLHNWDNGL